MNDLKKHPLSRRTFLRGLGVSMALPWLESLPVWGQDGSPARSEQPPVRFACVFAGNGFHSREWWARGEGAGIELGRALEQDGEGDEAIRHLQRSLALQPASAQAELLLGKAYARAGRTAEAEIHLKAAASYEAGSVTVR